MADFQRIKPILDPYPFMTMARIKRATPIFEDLRPTKVLEIGTYNGSGVCYWAEAIREYGGHVTTVDLQQTKVNPNVKTTPEELLEMCGLTNATVLRRKDGAAGFLREQIDKGVQYDIVYEDDGHTLKTIPQHFALGMAALKPGGWMIFDDLHTSPHPDVQWFWDKVVPTFCSNKYEIETWGFCQKPGGAPFRGSASRSRRVRK